LQIPTKKLHTCTKGDDKSGPSLQKLQKTYTYQTIKNPIKPIYSGLPK
jgi:hypothetical protein